MAAKQTSKKQTARQKSTPAAPKFSIARLLYAAAYTVVVVALVVLVLWAGGWHGRAASSSNHQNPPAQPVPLSMNTSRVHACSDSIATLSSYTYSAHYFFDLQQQGYHLAATLSQQAADGRSFTDADCAAYFKVRATHPATHIILQLFTRDPSGNPLPYQYKDLKPDTCYSSDTTHRTVCPHMPSYGIFVKD